MNTSLVVQTTDSNFSEDVLGVKGWVLVDFWANWCGPCKAIAPLLDSLAEQRQGQLRVVKINTAENPRTPVQLGIRSIPALLLFRDGVVQAQKVGALSKAQLSQFLDAHL